MLKYELRNWHGSIIRVLAKKDDQLFIIDCIHRKMPVWVNAADLGASTECSEEELYTATKTLPTLDCLSPAAHRIAHERYTLIAGALPFVADERLRTAAIQHISVERNISKQTLRRYVLLSLLGILKSICTEKLAFLRWIVIVAKVMLIAEWILFLTGLVDFSEMLILMHVECVAAAGIFAVFLLWNTIVNAVGAISSIFRLNITRLYAIIQSNHPEQLPCTPHGGLSPLIRF